MSYSLFKHTKYISFFIALGVQIQIFFMQFKKMTVIPLSFALPYALLQLVFFSLVIIYIVFYLKQKLSTKDQLIIEIVLALFLIVLSSWIYSMAIIEDIPSLDVLTTMAIVDRVMQYGIGIISTLLFCFSLIYSFFQRKKNSEVLEAAHSPFWNTKGVGDGFFLSLICGMLIFNSMLGSRLVSPYPRDYIGILQGCVVVFGYFVFWYHSRYYKFQRQFYLYFITGYGCSMIFYLVNHLIIVYPSNYQLLEKFNQSTRQLFFVGSIWCLFIFIYLFWLGVNYFQEYKTNNKK